MNQDKDKNVLFTNKIQKEMYISDAKKKCKFSTPHAHNDI